MRRHNWQNLGEFGTLTSGGAGSHPLVRETLGLSGEGEGPTQGFSAWLDKGLGPETSAGGVGLPGTVLSSCTDLCLCEGSGNPSNGAAALAVRELLLKICSGHTWHRSGYDKTKPTET